MAGMPSGWPERLFILRHGESAGNVARDLAERENRPFIDLGVTRELDVPLSALGERQARAVGDWLASLPEHERPTAAIVSPYRRTRQTAELALGRLPGVKLTVDERLREREFGILNRLTRFGIQARHPELVELRSTLGKMYFRPPGGESWCDVLLRLRSLLDTVKLTHADGRLLIVSHQVLVLLFRFLLEDLSEEKLLEIDSGQEIANCSITEFGFDPSVTPAGALRLLRFNHVAPIEAAGEQVTEERDATVAPS